jgi:hypothetical protein
MPSAGISFPNSVLEQPNAAVVSDRARLGVPMKPEKLGKLSFPTSCDPKVQAEFERGVAMIHSYWFLIARRTFEGVLREDPNCAMAYWGDRARPPQQLARGGAAA